jgi:hypothetical protein
MNLPKSTRITLRLFGLALLLASPAIEAAQSKLIVDFGHDWGVGWFRETPDTQPYAQRTRFGEWDVDGDGESSDDAIGGWDFAWDRPLSPENSRYDTTLPNARFYGGVVIEVADIAGERSKAPSEGHINQNHELRDDWNMMALPSVKKQPELEFYKGVGLWMWKKDEFLNGGDNARVSFEAGDYLAVFISRYFGGMHWARWVIQNEGVFYVSEKTFGGVTEPFHYIEGQREDGSVNPLVRKSHLIDPTTTRWATYEPKPNADFYFDAENASFDQVRFEQVDAVGFITQKNFSRGQPTAKALTLNEPIAVKFNAVQAMATVHRPEGSSTYLDLIEAPGGRMQMEDPVDFDTWEKIYKWAVTNQRASNFPEGWEDKEIPGYTFLNDGLPAGASALIEGEVTTAAAVSDIAWLDAVAWCNALSELEGLEPAYYTDPEYSLVFRTVADRSKLETFEQRPTIYWKSDSEGYRLPTFSEWSELVGEPKLAEWIWAAEDGSVPAGVSAAALGSLNLKETTALFPQKPYADGLPEISFRAIRGAGQPSAIAASGVQTFSVDSQVVPNKPIATSDIKHLVRTKLSFIDMGNIGSLPTNDNIHKNYEATPENEYPLSVAQSEVPWGLWNAVSGWAAQNKHYRFNHDGTPGSIRYPATDAGARQVSMSEPVTGITWMDAIIWCNALSELMGLDPVYLDPQTSEPLRHSLPFRLNTYGPYHYPNDGRYPQRPIDTASVLKLNTDPSKNGYRLPSLAEMEAVIQTRPAYSRPAMEVTHPVESGLEQEGIYGLHDNVAEWTYGGDRLFGQVIFGSDFAYPDGRRPHRMNSKDHLFVNRPYLGLRPVLRRSE